MLIYLVLFHSNAVLIVHLLHVPITCSTSTRRDGDYLRLQVDKPVIMRHATSKQPHLILITFLATENRNYYCCCILPRQDRRITKPLEMPRPKLTRVKKETKGEGSSERRRQTQVFFPLFPKIKPGKTPKHQKLDPQTDQEARRKRKEKKRMVKNL